MGKPIRKLKERTRFSIGEIARAWDQAIAGYSIRQAGSSRDSASFNALVEALLRPDKTKWRDRH